MTRQRGKGGRFLKKDIKESNKESKDKEVEDKEKNIKIKMEN
jgi:hypothetical protein